jgi:DNA-binding transcriptional regulator YhcF (GntR family)
MKPSYYAIIPANVRYSNLKPNTKLLYGEITALASKEGYCFASNRYFADLYDVTKNTISSWISDLHKAGFVKVQIIKEGNQVIERRIGITQKGDTPITKKKEYNSTSISNTISTLSNRKDFFIKEVDLLAVSTALDPINWIETREEFISYWSELNKSKTKMRWELERTWSTKKRLFRWIKNGTKWNKTAPKKNNIKNKMETFNRAKQMMDKINGR